MRYIHKGFRIQYVSRKKKNRDCEVDFTDYAFTFKARGGFDCLFKFTLKDSCQIFEFSRFSLISKRIGHNL